MYVKWGDPRRMAWVGANATGAAATNAFVSLFNNSTGPHVLAVHDVIKDSNSTTNIGGLALAQGVQGAGATPPTPAFGGEATPVGFASFGTVSSVPTFNTAYNGGGVPNNNTNPWPLFFLPPQWSLTAYAFTVNTFLRVQFWFEWRWMWEFPVVPNSPTDG
jgi:hypothetical protein